MRRIMLIDDEIHMLRSLHDQTMTITTSVEIRIVN